MKDEVFIGGVESSKLGKGMLWGYGMYVTSRRLIGVRKLAKAAMAGLLRDYGGWVTSEEKSDVLIKELEGMKKDFEIFKEDISQVEMKKPSALWGGGYLKIIPEAGGEIKIKIGPGKDFERLKAIFEKFKPEVLKLV